MGSLVDMFKQGNSLFETSNYTDYYCSLPWFIKFQVPRLFPSCRQCLGNGAASTRRREGWRPWLPSDGNMWGFPWMEDPPKGWLRRDNPIYKWMIWGYSLGNLQMVNTCKTGIFMVFLWFFCSNRLNDSTFLVRSYLYHMVSWCSQYLFEPESAAIFLARKFGPTKL